eukprot:snap_masked-scaffold_24-processed-gene-4.29-mRNA-1 protein AED:0.01 eAED:0.01 QI:0/-1/0/1/-1/1/1/0/890
MTSPDKVILPTHLEPVNYNLEINPTFSDPFEFTGKVTITFKVLKEKLSSVKEEEKNLIQLHAKQLTLKNATLILTSGKELATSSIEPITEEVKVLLKFDEDFLGEDYFKLTINYTGTHNDQMAGFYRCKTNSKAFPIMLSTQFEALDARRCFPCVDEPAAKATFDCSLKFPADLPDLDKLTVLGNCSVESDSIIGAERVVTFKTTPKMSTYLVCFCVGEFDYVEGTTEKGGVLVRVYTPPGRKESGNFALECAKKCLDIYDDMFGVKFPLPKMDMIAITEFAMGAMENWGLVTYREVDVLIEEKTASPQHKQRVASVVAHELAHQWFGNLVTMEWWDDLWLNEGFASWMQEYSCDIIFPEWRLWDQFVTNEQAMALNLDSLQSSHPIQVPIKHAEEVEEVFDAISYRKGACIVRLVYSFLGHENFLKGLKNYMVQYQYGNTITKDLWGAWEEASGLPVTEVMASWTEQMGFPVLKAELSENNTVKLSQRWFLADGSTPAEMEGKKWSIPIFISTHKNREPKQIGLMKDETFEFTLEHTLTGGYLKINAGQFVPLRVQYDDALMEGLTTAMKNKLLAPSDRAGLIMDTYALAKSGAVPASQVLSLVQSLGAETDFIVWEALSTAVGGLSNVLKTETELREKFRMIVKPLVETAAAQSGWDPSDQDGHLGKLQRNLMISMLEKYAYDSTDVLSEARKRFSAYVQNPTDPEIAKVLPTDFRQSVFRMVLKTSSSTEEYKQLKAVLDKLTDIAELKLIYLTLGSVASADCKKETLDWASSGELKLQDFFYPIAGVNLSGPGTLGVETTWEYFKTNIKKYQDMLKTASPSLFAAVVSYSASGFTSAEKANEIEDFFKQNETNVKRKIAQIVEATRTTAKFKDMVLADKKFIDMLN